ncbi:MAG: hypothetical protein C0606_16830 [Hyphomicrobiales bacterium]|nr:MAG: hypothetical protein C0606_16830 [Hyphomicrobiales bacterium]
MRKLIDRLVRPFGLRVITTQDAEMVYFHEYEGGYSQYRETQIFHNKRKLHHVWADKKTLSMIVDDLRKKGLGATGICHGARNGFEVEYFREQLGGDIIGSDISETAADFPNMVVWDFHEENPEWAGKFDFIYTNSLDQAFKPDQALASWVKQLKPGGRIYIEHTTAHAASCAGEMDPFGAHPMVMPYLLFKWGKGLYHLDEIVEVGQKEGSSFVAWVFVLAADE